VGMGRKKVRNSYPLEFKKKAVMMTTKEDGTVSDVAESLGISPQYLSKWRSELLNDDQFEKAEKRLDALEENLKLKEELKRLRMEVEILKKAASARSHLN
jgi:transposase